MTTSIIINAFHDQVSRYCERTSAKIEEGKSELYDDLKSKLNDIRQVNKEESQEELLQSLLEFQTTIIAKLSKSAELQQLPLLVHLRRKTERMIAAALKVQSQIVDLQKTRLKVFLDLTSVYFGDIETILKTLTKDVDLDFTDSSESAEAHIQFLAVMDRNQPEKKGEGANPPQIEWRLQFDGKTIHSTDLEKLKECLTKKVTFIQRGPLLSNPLSPLIGQVDLVMKWTDTKGRKQILDEEHPLQEGEIPEFYHNRNQGKYRDFFNLRLVNHSKVALYATLYLFEPCKGRISRIFPSHHTYPRLQHLKPGESKKIDTNFYCYTKPRGTVVSLFYMAFFSIQPHDFSWIQQGKYRQKTPKGKSLIQDEPKAPPYTYPKGDWAIVEREIVSKTYQMKLPEAHTLSVKQRLKILKLWQAKGAISCEIRDKFKTDLKMRLGIDNPRMRVMIGQLSFSSLLVEFNGGYQGAFYLDEGELTLPTLLNFRENLTTGLIEARSEGGKWRPIMPEDLTPFQKERAIPDLPPLLGDSIISDLSPLMDVSSGFVLNGTNSTSSILRLEKLNGQSISEIEESLRSWQWGFLQGSCLKKEESLLEILAQDNEEVQSEGLTHQKIAEPLRFIMTLALNSTRACCYASYNGRDYVISKEKDKMDNRHPFPLIEGRDKQDYIKCFFIMDLNTFKHIRVNEYLIESIAGYGFYGGGGERSRLEPKKLIDFFGLK